MLKTLFQDEFTIMMIVVCVIVILYFFAKFPSIRGLIYGILYSALIITAVGSVGHLNNYYNNSGGVIGEISSIFKKNQVEVVKEEDKIGFDFKNVVLMKNSKGVYTASMTSDQILKLDNNQTYFIYVNGEPCTIAQAEQRDVYATYEYTFMERENGEYYVLADDVMTFYFAFYDNFSYLRVEVENGENTYKLWNNYFNKNNFKVTIEKVDKSFYDTTEYSEIDIVLNGSVYKNVTIKNGATYTLPTAEEMTCDDFTFNYWIDEQGNQITAIENISEDRTIIANVTNNYTVTYMVDGVIVKTLTQAENSIVSRPTTPEKSGYTFLYWVDEDGEIVNFSDLRLTKNYTITAVFERGYTYYDSEISAHEESKWYQPTFWDVSNKQSYATYEFRNEPEEIYNNKTFKEMDITFNISFSLFDLSTPDNESSWDSGFYISARKNTTVTLKPNTTTTQTITYDVIEVYRNGYSNVYKTYTNVQVTYKVESFSNYFKITASAWKTSIGDDVYMFACLNNPTEIKLYTV